MSYGWGQRSVIKDQPQLPAKPTKVSGMRPLLLTRFFFGRFAGEV
jgi:hypothetical protein